MVDVSKVDPFILSSVAIEDRGNLPNISAIYFAISKGKILYVGKALFLRNRWTSHNMLASLDSFDDVRIAWMPLGSINNNDRSEKNMMSKKLESIEEACINFFRPLFNRTRLCAGVPKSTIDQVDEIMRITGMSKHEVFIKAFDHFYQEVVK